MRDSPEKQRERKTETHNDKEKVPQLIVVVDPIDHSTTQTYTHIHSHTHTLTHTDTYSYTNIESLFRGMPVRVSDSVTLGALSAPRSACQLAATGTFLADTHSPSPSSFSLSFVTIIAIALPLSPTFHSIQLAPAIYCLLMIMPILMHFFSPRHRQHHIFSQLNRQQFILDVYSSFCAFVSIVS